MTKAVADAREISGVDIVEEVYWPVISACNVIAVPLAISPKGITYEKIRDKLGIAGIEQLNDLRSGYVSIFILSAFHSLPFDITGT